jgi:uncharacterized protein
LFGPVFSEICLSSVLVVVVGRVEAPVSKLRPRRGTDTAADMRKPPAEAIEVPHARLPEATLRRVIEEFVTRSGTDYGAKEKALDEKVADVRRQLERGEAKLIFDPDTETTNIVRTGSDRLAAKRS